jgi:hypothetical protein
METWKEQNKQIGRNTLKKMCSTGTTVNKVVFGIPDILVPDFRICTCEYFRFSSVQYSALLHLPPLRFHCADGCWDRSQDRCNYSALAVRRSNH